MSDIAVYENSLNGAVQRQGIKVNVEDWLNMGSETWGSTPPIIKGAAYQAALAVGWKDAGLKKFAMDKWGPIVDDFAVSTTIDLLKTFAKENPFEIKELKKDDNPSPVFKIQGCKKTIPFPS